MQSSQLRLGRIIMFHKKTFINLSSVRLVFIFIAFVCFGILFGCSGGSGNSASFEFNNNQSKYTVDKTFEDDILVENHIRVDIEANNGEVVVTGQSDATHVIVTAHLSVTAKSRADAELHLDDLDVLVTDDTNEIIIQTIQPEIFDGREYRVQYDIIVPSNFEVITSQVNGSIEIINIENNIDVSNTNGGALLINIVGGIVADVENGGIEGTVVLPANETIDLSTNNGIIDLNIPISTSAEFSATVGIGQINVSNLNILDSVNTNTSLTGTLGNGEGSIVLRTGIGNIEAIGFD